MTQRYENIMVAVDGSKEADLAFVKGVQSAVRNQAKLTIAHVIDTRALQSISTFDAEVYEELQVEAQDLMAEYEKRARDAGLTDIQVVIEMGNPKTLLAKTIPEQEHVDLILVEQQDLTPSNVCLSDLHQNISYAIQALTFSSSETRIKLYN